MPASLRGIVRNLKRRGLVVVISDLIDDPEETLKSLRLLRSHRHDVIVFHVQDAAELDFSFEGATLFRDLETGEELEIDPAAVRDAYREQMRRAVRVLPQGTGRGRHRLPPDQHPAALRPGAVRLPGPPGADPEVRR